MRLLVIKERESGQRLDKYLGKYLKEAPKSFVYKMLRKKNITLNGKKAEGKEKLKTEDEIRLFLAEETLEKFCGGAKEVPVQQAFLPRQKKLDVVYENRDVLFVNKAVGMLSQKADKEGVSLCEYVIAYLLETKALTKEDLRTFRPGVCNRLDRNTSGLVAAGKTLKGLQELSACFKERILHKYYLAAVVGEIQEPAHIKGYLVKDEKKNQVQVYRNAAAGGAEALPIETKYLPLEVSKKGCTLLQVELLTGRTHQIRSHLASIGHPVLGDWKYGDRKVNERLKKEYAVQSQLLHAWRLEFPKAEEVPESLAGKTLTAQPPKSFRQVLKGEGFSTGADTLG